MILWLSVLINVFIGVLYGVGLINFVGGFLSVYWCWVLELFDWVGIVYKVFVFVWLFFGG